MGKSIQHRLSLAKANEQVVKDVKNNVKRVKASIFTNKTASAEPKPIVASGNEIARSRTTERPLRLRIKKQDKTMTKQGNTGIIHAERESSCVSIARITATTTVTIISVRLEN